MIDSEKLKAILEAALLAADEPLTVDQFTKLFRDGELDTENLRSDIREALKLLETEVEGRGYELIRVASGYRFQVRQELSNWVSRLWEEKPPRYSRALLETLALIAYKQPVTRGDIEEVRGVSVSQSIMRTLVERGWIRVVGQREVPGHPAMYGTTRAFLDYFNLKSLDQLPPLPEIRELIEPVIVAENPEEGTDAQPAKVQAADTDGADTDGADTDSPDTNSADADSADADSAEADSAAEQAMEAEAGALEEAAQSDEALVVAEESLEPAAVVEVGEVSELADREQPEEVSNTAEVVQLPPRNTEMSRRPARGKRPNQHDAEAETSTPVKLQKVLAEAGLGSRREMERWIESGRIEVNGETAHLGQRVGPSDRIRADGRLLGRGSSHGSRVLLYNKPAGVVCTRRDPEGRPTVFDKLPELNRGRWISIGRLDIASSGLLLLTNDGALANTMMHPSTGLDREYAVRVNGELSSEDMARALAGVDDDGERLAFSDIQHYAGSGHNHWYHVALLEGKNREIRRVFAQLGYSVSRLKRVRFGPVVLPSRLSRGRSAELERDDLKALYKLLKLPVPEMPAERRRRGKPAPSVLIPYPELHQRS